MLNKNQDQQVSGSGIAVQGGGDVNIEVTNNGLSYTDVRAIAKDQALIVFKENFPKFQGEAMKLATERGAAITEEFFKKLQMENPDGINQAGSPDFQDALFTVQKEYAKAGDEELGQLLVDLLVDRTKEPTRTTLQIVLNESLHVAPKLTSTHLAILAVVFILKYTKLQFVENIDSLNQYLTKHILHFANSDLLPNKEGAFQHLQYTGCGSVSMGSISLEQLFRTHYGGLFNHGFEESRLLELGITISSKDSIMFMPCLNDLTKLQVKAASMEYLRTFLDIKNTSIDQKQKMELLFQENMFSDEEIKRRVISFSPFMDSIFNAWSYTKLQSFELTSVGIAIGYANIKRISGEFSNLSIWIN